MVAFQATVSCDHSTAKKTEKEEVSAEVPDVEVKPTPVFKSLLSEEVDVQNIKSQLNEVTTTFVSKSLIKNYLDKGNNKYFGHYTLIKDSMSTSVIVGDLVVYDSINPKIFDKKTDEFVELTLTKKGVSVYNDKVEVGMKVDSILKYFGTSHWVLDDTWIFNYENKKAFFKIKDSTATKIKIGIYKPNLSHEKILEGTKW